MKKRLYNIKGQTDLEIAMTCSATCGSFKFDVVECSLTHEVFQFLLICINDLTVLRHAERASMSSFSRFAHYLEQYSTESILILYFQFMDLAHDIS